MMIKSKKTLSLELLLILIISLLIIPNSIIDTSDAASQSGFFEGEVPIHGAYLQTINCDPRYATDDDGDGVLDAGFMGQYVEGPLIVDLEANGFYEGEKIMISHKQSIYNVLTNQVWYFNLFGLFSSSRDLLTDNWEYQPSSGDEKWPIIGPEKRVPGAIDVSLGGYVHPSSTVSGNTNTWKQGMEVQNDIPEDFEILGHLQFNEGKNGDQWTQDTYAFNNWFWVTIPQGAKYLFFQVVSYWSLSHDGYCKLTIDKDSDGDSIPDSWEREDIDFNKDGIIDLTLDDADFERKDLYVEIDYMGGDGTCPGHKPDAEALKDVWTAFYQAPGDLVNNPDGTDGINLHIDTENWDELIHRAIFKPWSDFHKLKEDFFGTEAERQSNNAKWTLLVKKYTHHYCMFIHQWSEEDGGMWVPTTHAGLAEIGGNDFLVSLGGWTTNPGTRNEQAATFMHELGHNLGLLHGGNETNNFKPNYLSIMNYMFTYESAVHTRPLDYSRKELARLNEFHLDERVGLGVTSISSYNQLWWETGWAYQDYSLTPPSRLKVDTLRPIDWNNNGKIDDDTSEDLNDFPQWGHPSDLEVYLTGYNDWINLNFYFQDSDYFASGAEPQVLEDEITWELAQEIREVWDQFDPLPIPEPDPSDSSYEPEDDETSIDILPIIGGIAVIAIILLVLLFIIKNRRS